MVVVVDLEDSLPSIKPLHHSLAAVRQDTPADTDTTGEDARPNPNVNGFSAALSCYPIARQLATLLDLETLHNLSRTCRQYRANLLEYRDQLVKHSLRCASEDLDPGAKLAQGLRQARSDFSSRRQLTSGKIGRCARDLVGECQRCGTIVCRNCILKPQQAGVLRARHRRLCRTCTKVPLQLLTAPKRTRSVSEGTPSPSALLDLDPFADDAPRAFTAAAFERTPCICEDKVWLCQPCGLQLKNNDTLYVRAWSWRTRYSHYIGGVGTGAGEGNEGVECGRGSNCLVARIVEHEIECDAETMALSEAEGRWPGTSYHAQEIEGIGGGFKMKVKKHVLVGECVKIYEDERDRSIQYLEREVKGKLRSWCSWCERVVLGEKDLAEAAGKRPPSSSGSSASSRS